MKLEYYKARPGNFGDDLNAWLWPRLLPGLANTADCRHLIGFGSILDARYSVLAETKIVFGSGARSRSTVPRLGASWDVRFVRGPLTAAALGLNPMVGVTDGAAALACLKLERGKSIRGVGFMPHYRTLAIVDWKRICEQSAIQFIDPTSPVADVIDAIGRVDRLVTEALHGAIVADLFRVPWTRVCCHSTEYEGSEVSEFKWADWGGSLEIEVAAEPFVAISLPSRSLAKRAVLHPIQALRRSRLGYALRRVAESTRFRLSDNATLARAVNRINGHVLQLGSELAITAHCAAT